MNAPAVVLTFWPHPATVLGNSVVKCLTTPDERAALLFDLGVDVVITQVFDQSVANTSAYDFAARLKQHLGMKHMLMGYDFALGKGREGDAARLSVIGRELGYSVEVVPALSDETDPARAAPATSSAARADTRRLVDRDRHRARLFYVPLPFVQGKGQGSKGGILRPGRSARAYSSREFFRGNEPADCDECVPPSPEIRDDLRQRLRRVPPARVDMHDDN